MDAQEQDPGGIERVEEAHPPTQSAAASLLLIAITALALVAANSDLASLYDAVCGARFAWSIGSGSVERSLAQWVDDGPMALFFLLVSIEIKREFATGATRGRGDALLPVGAAIGGMVVPALLYLLFDGRSGMWRGWAIPSATDIAFSLGMLGLFGRGLPPSLRTFLAALAIMDDLGAIVIIALFYAARLSPAFLGLAALGVIALFLLNRRGTRSIWPYLAVGVYVWACLLPAGVHPTLAGVATGLAMPAGGRDAPLQRLERLLRPLVDFLVVPVFAFVNAGVGLGGVGARLFDAPVPGIAFGLFVGKPAGVLMASEALIRLRLARVPQGASWRVFVAVALLTGIGFTMSLFIGDLAFTDPALQGLVRLGVLAGSLASAVAGAATLTVYRLRHRRRR